MLLKGSFCPAEGSCKFGQILQTSSRLVVEIAVFLGVPMTVLRQEHGHPVVPGRGKRLLLPIVEVHLELLKIVWIYCIWILVQGVALEPEHVTVIGPVKDICSHGWSDKSALVYPEISRVFEYPHMFPKSALYFKAEFLDILMPATVVT